MRSLAATAGFVVALLQAVVMMLILLTIFLAGSLWAIARIGRTMLKLLRGLAVLASRLAFMLMAVTVAALAATGLVQWAQADDITCVVVVAATVWLAVIISTRFTRRWCARPMLSERRSVIDDLKGAPPTKDASLPRLVSVGRMKSLAALEKVLAEGGACDPLSLALSDWEEFCRRRVPDLIRAVDVIYTEAADHERIELKANLDADLAAIIAEGERRLDTARAAARDHLRSLRIHVGVRTSG